MEIDHIDHIVLTVRNIDTTCSFYTGVLGMEKIVFGENRIALGFGNQKINLHLAGREIEPKADRSLPGTADLCLVTREPLNTCIAHLKSSGVDIILGPVDRTGAVGPIRSIYFRDPDGNLIELANDLAI